MREAGIFLRFTRLFDYVHVLVLLFPLILLISPGDLFSYRTVIVFLANLCLTAFGYMYNDLEDADDDYHDVEKRRRNPVASGEITKRQSSLFNLILVSAGLFLYSLISPLVFMLGIVFALVGFVYSWNTLKLKSRPILDLVSHVIFLGALQFLTTFAAFRPLDLSVVPYLMIIVPFSLMNEVIHEMGDFEVDKQTKINNTVQRFEGFDLTKLLIAMLATVVIGCSIIVFTIHPEYRIITISISLFFGVPMIYRMNARVTRIAQAR
jgi:4-hydroxybenzoate polyprenyltransferase